MILIHPHFKAYHHQCQKFAYMSHTCLSHQRSFVRSFGMGYKMNCNETLHFLKSIIMIFSTSVFVVLLPLFLHCVRSFFCQRHSTHSSRESSSYWAFCTHTHTTGQKGGMELVLHYSCTISITVDDLSIFVFIYILFLFFACCSCF